MSTPFPNTDSYRKTALTDLLSLRGKTVVITGTHLTVPNIVQEGYMTYRIGGLLL